MFYRLQQNRILDIFFFMIYVYHRSSSKYKYIISEINIFGGANTIILTITATIYANFQEFNLIFDS